MVERDDDGPEPPARGRADAPRRRGRWLAAAVLGIALVGAAGAAVMVVRGRDTARSTQSWLDSTTAPGSAGGEVGAASAATTRENTTGVPVRRTGGARRAEPEPDAVEEEVAPPADTAVAVEPDEAPVLQPTPPIAPPRPGRPIRPTVPRPDTLAPPDSLAAR